MKFPFLENRAPSCPMSFRELGRKTESKIGALPYVPKCPTLSLARTRARVSRAVPGGRALWFGQILDSF